MRSSWRKSRSAHGFCVAFDELVPRAWAAFRAGLVAVTFQNVLHRAAGDGLDANPLVLAQSNPLVTVAADRVDIAL